MKKFITNIVKKVLGKSYIHIPKWMWLKNLLKKILIVERVRGRGRNWDEIKKTEWELCTKYKDYIYGGFIRRLGYDGHIPMKYASYLYLKLK